MVCKKCGNNKFYAHQRLYTDVIVDESGSFLSNMDPENADKIHIYEAEHPYGPFTCTACGEEYDELEG